MRKTQVAYLFVLLSSILFLGSCTVSKAPYFTTDYYRNTVNELERKKTEVRVSEDSVYGGFARISITPGLNNVPGKRKHSHNSGIPIAGFGQLKTKYATAIHDSIFVRAVSLKTGNQTVVIVSADMLLMPPDIIDSVVSRLSSKGIRRDQLFFSATHSHSSIGGWGYGPLSKIIAGKENTYIEKWLADQIESAIMGAVSDLSPVKICSGNFKGAQFIRNRLTGNPDQLNTDFDYILIEKSSGEKAIIGSFSAHATNVGSKNTMISADYPGYWSGKLERSGFCLAMFCGGSMGSQSPVGEGSQYESAEFIGNALADSILDNIKDTKQYSTAKISCLSLKIGLPAYHMRMTENLNFSTRMSNRLMEQPQDVYLQALKINRLIWFTTPGDYSGESALMIKNLMAAKGCHAMVTGYNGSYIGYILPGKYFYLKNYESKDMGWFGPTLGDYIFDILLQIGNILSK